MGKNHVCKKKGFKRNNPPAIKTLNKAPRFDKFSIAKLEID